MSEAGDDATSSEHLVKRPGKILGHSPTTSGAVAFVSSIVALLAVSVAGIVALRSDDLWTPLGPFPTQTVRGTTTFDSPEPGDNIVYPAIHIDDDAITVTGTKCYQEEVQVAGTVSWSSVQPPGLSLFVGEGIGDRAIGCVENTYENLIPATVVAWAGARFAEGEEYVLVRITGREIASDKDGHESTPLTWRTETFALLPAVD